MVIIKNYKVKKNYSTNSGKDWNKLPEIFRENFRTHNPSQYQQSTVCSERLLYVLPTTKPEFCSPV